MSSFRSLLARSRPPATAWALVLLSTIPFALAGLDHGRLFHRGFAETGLVGTLFLLNALATGASLLLLISGRVRVYLLAVLAISIPSIAAIFLSHSGIGMFGLREGEWDLDALLIVGSEAVASLLAVAAIATGGLRDGHVRPHGAARPRALAAIATAVVFLLVVAGLGQGGPPVDTQPLTGDQLSAAEKRVDAAGTVALEGEELFGAAGCSKCHTVSAGDYDGALGPQLDFEESGEDPEDIVGAIIDRDEPSLMRTDYSERLTDEQALAIASYLSAAAAPEADDD